MPSTDLTSRHERVQRASLAVAKGVQFGIHAARGQANQASTPPFFDVPTGRRVMCLQIGGGDHDHRLLTVISGKTGHHLGKDALVAPPFPTVVKRLVRP